MRASECSWAPKKNPHEMDSEKGNVKIGRKVECPQILATDRPRKDPAKAASSGWTRTSNPPVNSVTQVVGLAGFSCR